MSKSPFDGMKYGPIGEAVAKAAPGSEADPIGIYAAVLALFSSSLGGRVLMDSGRPVVVWTVLAGKSALGRKGYALNTARKILNPSIGAFIDTHAYSGISSGPSLVNMMWQQELETAGTEAGTDGRTLIVEEEWAAQLRRSKRDANFSQQLRTAWDGKPVSNTTKKETQYVSSPLLGFHAHITPGEWSRYVAGSTADALGGSYNRILPVVVERSKLLPYDHVATVKETKALTAAYKWSQQETRYMTFAPEAGRRYDELRSEIEDRMADMPERLSCFLERSAEQVTRVAAVLTAAERKTVITKRALEAAWAFVAYSMVSVEKLVNEAETSTPRIVKSLPDLIREKLAFLGGEASSTMLLRSLGTRVNAAALKVSVQDMDDVETYRAQSGGRGAPSIMYRLVKPESEPEAKAKPDAPAVEEIEHQEEEAKPKRTTRARKAPARLSVVEKQAPPAAKRARPTKKVTASANPLADLLAL
ncbi:DUF3987 domain-containing protein [Streptomyces sp. CBMA29]|uniref:DUF3987 domain-containing protein n=1 Tax=Streptomyces sp. CBMA29 TaxID=1896314 RepID=UPI001661C000|nr:DUF3987 domain-containing protein [Streptomyces sp. CBMA29]MBD0739825.1 hypothetical protein [Streptomyces sp. CBMA29]